MRRFDPAARRAPARASLEITVSTVPAARAAARGLGPWLTSAAPRSARGTVDVAVVTDAAMRRLNRRFRGVDAATDVLSFPATREDRADRRLGDIAIAHGVAARQAGRIGHPVRQEVRVLALHGLLHLMGYDHERDNGRMRRMEARLLIRAGEAAGLISRADGSRGRS